MAKAKPVLKLVKRTSDKEFVGELQQWFDEFPEAKKAAVCAKTLRKYRTAIEPYIEHVGPHHWPPTRFDVTDYLDAVKQRTSKMTAFIYWSSLRVWFNYIDVLGGFEGYPNPAIQIRDLKLAPKEPKPKPKGARETHLTQLFDFLAAQPDSTVNRRDRVLLRFIWRTGARRGEACRLRRDQLDFDEQCAILSAEETKDREERKLVFGCTIKRELEEWLNFLDELGYDEPWVFPSVGHRGQKTPRSHPISGDGTRAMFRRRCTQAGIPDYTIHELRHTFVKDALAARKNPDSVRRQLGHSDMRMTLYYAQVFDDGQHEDFCDFGDDE